MLVAIYALVWSVRAVLMFAAFRWLAPRSPQPSFARALVWSAALLALGELAAIAWEPARVCVFVIGLFLFALQTRVGVIRSLVIVVATVAGWLGFCGLLVELSQVVSKDAIAIAVPGVILGAWAIRLVTSRAGA